MLYAVRQASGRPGDCRQGVENVTIGSVADGVNGTGPARQVRLLKGTHQLALIQHSQAAVARLALEVLQHPGGARTEASVHE